MNAESELLRAYREWRRLAQAEAKAIQTRNWNLLSDCHLAIQDYQSLVRTLTEETRAEWRLAGCNLAEKEQNLRVLVADLLELTRQNHSRMQASLARARDKLDQLGEAGNNLKRLRRAYGGLAVCGQPN
jgi:hypothetical protein